MFYHCTTTTNIKHCWSRPLPFYYYKGFMITAGTTVITNTITDSTKNRKNNKKQNMGVYVKLTVCFYC